MIHRIGVALVAVVALTAGCVQAGTIAKPQEQRGMATSLSRAEVAAIRDKVKQCWNIDSTSTAKPIVRLRVARMNPDGTVPRDAVSILDDGGDRQWANAARRAVVNPVCQPWLAPRGGWPDEGFVLVFDPQTVF